MMNSILKIAVLLMLLSGSTYSVEIVDDYKLNLTSSGPAVHGSYINFQAQLYLGTSKTPQDKKLFRYDWRDSVYLLTERQHANLNTSYKPCYDLDVDPDTYNMRVTVYDAKGKPIFSPVTRQDIDFNITSTLNGNLKHNQTVHRGLHAHNNTFSTNKTVHFMANLTDIFDYPPTFTYKWSIDGKEYMVGNFKNMSKVFTKTGKHVVKVDIESSGIPVDCRGFEYKDSLKGSFKTEIVLKDPVFHSKLDGKTNITKGDNLKLQALFNGSAPYTFCWKLKLLHKDKELDRVCYNKTDRSKFEIYVPRKKLSTTGNYSLMIYIENDVSVLTKTHFVSVNEVPEPPNYSSHSAAYILVPVISAVVVVSLFVLGGIYYINHRKKRTHIEEADFQFHSSIQRTSNDGWLLSNVRDMFTGLMRSDNEKINTSDGRRLSAKRQSYGSMVNPVETT